MRTIVTSPEFFSDQAYRAKVKKPLELVVSAVRALGAEAEAYSVLPMAVGRIGERNVSTRMRHSRLEFSVELIA